MQGFSSNFAQYIESFIKVSTKFSFLVRRKRTNIYFISVKYLDRLGKSTTAG
jgi:hypothetical protein